MFDPAKCLLDRACAAACPERALAFVDAPGVGTGGEDDTRPGGRVEAIGRRRYEPRNCVRCGRCAEVCFPKALELVGRELTVDEAFAELEPDRPFYQRSGGGITVSGGEPLYQAQFVRDLLAQCRREGLHTALDTTGFGPWESLASVLAHTDLVLLDLKHMDPVQHAEYTGVDNRQILENARALAEWARERELPAGADAARYGVWVRVPVVPAINDSQDQMRAMARFAREEMAGAVKAVELLGYHQLGGSKYQRLGRPMPMPELRPPTRDHLRRLTELVRAELGPGVRVTAR
jgi:pyruvate formate lyase activating enzyme